MAVFKSKHGTWGFNIYVKEKPRIRKQGFRTKSEATLEMSKVLNDVSSGKYFIEDRNKDLLKTLTVEQWLTKWNEDRNRTKSVTYTTYKTAKGYFKNIFPLIGHVLLKKLNRDHLRKVINFTIDKGLSEQTTNHYLNTIKSSLTYAVDEEILERSIAYKMKGRKVIKSIPFVFEREDQGKLLKSALEYSEEINDYTPYMTLSLSLYSGLILSELAGLTWEDVDFENNLIDCNKKVTWAYGESNPQLVRELKTDFRRRQIPLPPHFMEELQAYKIEKSKMLLKAGIRIKPTDFVITYKDGGALRKSNTELIFRKVLKRTDITYIPKKTVMKNFRHSFVSNNHHSGMPIMYISRLVGHSNYKTTSERYSNMFDDKGAKYLDKASEHLKNIRISSEQK